MRQCVLFALWLGVSVCQAQTLHYPTSSPEGQSCTNGVDYANYYQAWYVCNNGVYVPEVRTNVPLPVPANAASGLIPLMGLANPFTAVYPAGINYPDTKSTDTTALFVPNASMLMDNQLAYGDLNTATTATFGLNSNRPACASGYTAPGQAGLFQEFDAVALCANADTIPPLFKAAGTFTSTTFVPTTNLTTVSVTYPFGSPATVTEQSLLRVGMWLQTDDAIPYLGQITNVGSGTSITVSGWFKEGISTGGTPSGASVYANPINHTWAFLPEIFLNQLGTSTGPGTFAAPTGTTTSGSATITSVSTTAGVMFGQLISGAGIPANTAVLSSTSNSITISQNATATASGVALNISAAPANHGIIGEMDIYNSGPAFVPFEPVTVTGGVATSGSNTITGLSSVPSTIRPGLWIYTNSASVPQAAAVVSKTSTTVTLNKVATGNATGVSLTFYSDFDESGAGFGCSGVANNANNCFSVSGSVSYGYVAHGAADSAFLVRPDGTGALPAFGYRSDGSLLGQPTHPFSVSNGAATPCVWCVGASGFMGVGTDPVEPIDLNGTGTYGIYLRNSGTLSTVFGQAFGSGDWQAGSAAGDFVLQSKGHNIYLTNDTSGLSTPAISITTVTALSKARIVPTSSAPSTCAASGDIGNIWFDNSTTTTAFKVCKSVSSVIGWSVVTTTP